LCGAQALGLQTQIPPPKSKPQWEAVHEAAVLVGRRGRLLLMRCPQRGRWAGLWDFPRFAIQETDPAALGRELVQNVRKLTGVIVQPGKHLQTIKHGVTRFRITLDCYRAQYVATSDGEPAAAEMRWLRPAELDQYPLSSTGRKLAKLGVGRHSDRQNPPNVDPL
jgi:A/G-specific adenine glycosylase